MLDKLGRKLSALIRFLAPNYLQMLTEKRPGEILADFKKILDILNFTSVSIFSPFYQE